jgi:fumarate hydratase class II
MKYVEGAKRVFMETGTRFPREIIWAVALIKREAAAANSALGLLDPAIASAIVAAATEVMEGKHDTKVLVDVFQTGSGTGLNMNMNEVIAERATELMLLPSPGRRTEKGDDDEEEGEYRVTAVHPNDHVNMGQSSNDVGPSAIRIAAVALCMERLVPALVNSSKRLIALSKRTSTVYKAGRTHLRDALPVTMGQEFASYGDALDRDLRLLKDVLKFLKELPIGGTAVGTGLNAHPRFGRTVIRRINGSTRLGFSEAKSKSRAMKLLSDLVVLSSSLSVVALDIYRLCQDIRLMFSGPLTGLGEIEIPTQEEVAGSSIMPGKTNPITVESAMLVSAQVMGLDRANQVAGMLGEFELSMGVPLTGYNVITQIALLSEALTKLSSVVLDHITPEASRAAAYAERSQALVTAISPTIGYDRAVEIGKEVARGLSIRDGLRRLGYTDQEVDNLLDLRRLVGDRASRRR